MENAAHALHMAFAMFVFLIAISLAFTAFSSAREVADVVLYVNDQSNFEEFISEASTNRVVGIEAIIPEIRRYITHNEGYSIKIIDNISVPSLSLTITLDNQTNELDEDKEGQVISEPSELKAYRTKCLDTITEKYQFNNDVKFVETFSEVAHKGGTIEVDGEVLEKVNTETNVKITYTRIQ